MKLFIAPNLSNDELIFKTKKIINKLIELGYECFTSDDNKNLLSLDYISPSLVDLIVSIGGDGAVLRASKLAIKNNKPLVGINAGNLGFLCAISYNEIDTMTNDTFNELIPQSRNVLTAKINNKTYVAVNDVVISKSYSGTTVGISVSTGDVELVSYRGDGLIISTPTGSSAYNLSAGGPLMMPNVSCNVITAVCPHFFGINSIVISDKEKLHIRINKRDIEHSTIYFDGINVVNKNEEIVVKTLKKKLIIYMKKDFNPVPIIKNK